IHSMVRVFDLERSRSFYEKAFGMVESHRLEFPTFSLVYLRDPESGAEIELTLNNEQTESYTQGNGYGHGPFCAPDLELFREGLGSEGYESGDIKTLSVEGVLMARFFFITDPDGYKIEVLERAGHYV